MNKSVFLILKSAGRYVFKMANSDAGRMVITGVWNIVSDMNQVSIIDYAVVQVCGDSYSYLRFDHSLHDRYAIACIYSTKAVTEVCCIGNGCLYADGICIYLD